MNCVDIEINERIRQGFRLKFDADMEETELAKFKLLVRLCPKEIHPLVSTFAEMDSAVGRISRVLTF